LAQLALPIRTIEDVDHDVVNAWYKSIGDACKFISDTLKSIEDGEKVDSIISKYIMNKMGSI
jgi:asparagine synthetase A